jgi:hypothetical protein
MFYQCANVFGSNVSWGELESDDRIKIVCVRAEAGEVATNFTREISAIAPRGRSDASGHSFCLTFRE